MINKLSRVFAASFVVFLAFTANSFSQTSPSKEFGIKIKNFGKMDDRFYRGAQPKRVEDYAALKALGIQTVVDLQAEPTDYEKREVEALGMRYVNIPIKDKGYPTQENVDMFLKLIDDPETGVFFAHCAGGRHRTGNVGALYRFVKYGWDFDQAYKEMKNYDFYSSWGHGKQKDFVVDYAAKYETDRAAKNATATAAAGTAQ